MDNAGKVRWKICSEMLQSSFYRLKSQTHRIGSKQMTAYSKARMCKCDVWV